MILVSRETAKTNGLTRYYTGQPCKHGHVAERQTSNQGCIECLRKRHSDWRKRHPGKERAAKRAYCEANREKVRAVKNAWNKAHPEGQKARSRKWYEQNKEKSFANHRKWAAANPQTVTAAAARRRAAVRQRVPCWADHSAILAVYEAARAMTASTGIEHHVDHIVPIQHERVSGLHVPHNLQILPGTDNRSKSNRFWPDM